MLPLLLLLPSLDAYNPEEPLLYGSFPEGFRSVLDAEYYHQYYECDLHLSSNSWGQSVGFHLLSMTGNPDRGMV